MRSLPDAGAFRNVLLRGDRCAMSTTGWQSGPFLGPVLAVRLRAATERRRKGWDRYPSIRASLSRLRATESSWFWPASTAYSRRWSDLLSVPPFVWT